MKNPGSVTFFNYIKRVTVIVVVYMALIISFSYISYNNLSKDLKEELGNKAMVLAIDIAKWVEMDEKEFDRLLSMDFNAVLKDKSNVSFEGNARGIMDYSNIKYIYLESKVPDKAVKYSVGKDEESVYDAKEGTPLNVVYLLDAVVSDQVRMEDTDGKWYTDVDRYTVMTPVFEQIYENQKPTYLINEDQWGSYITGYAPTYSKNGKYVGMIGVDLFLDSYYQYLQKNVFIFGGFVFALLLAGILLFYLMMRMWKAEERVRIEKELASTDPLTGLLNRRSFNDLARHEFFTSRRDNIPMSLLIIDIDNFKKVNDNYGHIKGDKVLSGVAHSLKDVAKRNSDIIARFGGDEFVIVLHNTGSEGAKIVSERILDEIQKKIFHEKGEAPIKVTVTIGVSTIVPDNETDIETLFQQGDEAYYHAKGLGGNCYYCWVDELHSKK